MGLSMTAADLCSSYKQWEVQRSNVSIIMEEFFQQVIDWLIILCIHLSCSSRSQESSMFSWLHPLALSVSPRSVMLSSDSVVWAARMSFLSLAVSVYNRYPWPQSIYAPCINLGSYKKTLSAQLWTSSGKRCALSCCFLSSFFPMSKTRTRERWIFHSHGPLSFRSFCAGRWRKASRHSTTILNGSIASTWTTQESGQMNEPRLNLNLRTRSFLGELHQEYLYPVLFVDCPCSPGNNAHARWSEVSRLRSEKDGWTVVMICSRSNLQRWQELADEHQLARPLTTSMSMPSSSSNEISNPSWTLLAD